MANKPKFKMTISIRAKQFLPFASLTDLEMVIQLKTKKSFNEERKLLSNELKQEINNIINKINKNDFVLITHYLKDRYVTNTCLVKKVDVNNKQLILFDEKIINFNDIYQIEIL